jgi:hypothetical protein
VIFVATRLSISSAVVSANGFEVTSAALCTRMSNEGTRSDISAAMRPGMSGSRKSPFSGTNRPPTPSAWVAVSVKPRAERAMPNTVAARVEK